MKTVNEWAEHYPNKKLIKEIQDDVIDSMRNFYQILDNNIEHIRKDLEKTSSTNF